MTRRLRRQTLFVFVVLSVVAVAVAGIAHHIVGHIIIYVEGKLHILVVSLECDCAQRFADAFAQQEGLCVDLEPASLDL